MTRIHRRGGTPTWDHAPVQGMRLPDLPKGQEWSLVFDSDSASVHLEVDDSNSANRSMGRFNKRIRHHGFHFTVFGQTFCFSTNRANSKKVRAEFEARRASLKAG